MIEKQNIETDVLIVAIAVAAFGAFCVVYTLTHVFGLWACQ